MISSLLFAAALSSFQATKAVSAGEVPYPIQSVAEGVVVLGLSLDAGGRISSFRGQSPLFRGRTLSNTDRLGERKVRRPSLCVALAGWNLPALRTVDKQQLFVPS